MGNIMSAILLIFVHVPKYCLKYVNPFGLNYLRKIKLVYKANVYFDGLVQERRNTSALALELRLSCANPSIWSRMYSRKSCLPLVAIFGEGAKHGDKSVSMATVIIQELEVPWSLWRLESTGRAWMDWNGVPRDCQGFWLNDTCSYLLHGILELSPWNGSRKC